NANDVSALASVLAKHRDSCGRSACMVMNFCTANLDFDMMKPHGFENIQLLSLSDGLPRKWTRPGLTEAYRDGIRTGVFYPARHGRAHFCGPAVERVLREDRERARLLRAFWEAETPYIYWRMPWVGYEFWNPGPRSEFLSCETQQSIV